MESGINKETLIKNKKLLEDLIKRRFVYTQAFEIHGGVAGLYDYGPVGCAIKTNIEQLWRDHFILEEDMLEIRGTCVTPISVLKASGHVDRFTDLMVRDVKTNTCYRADKLLVDFVETKLAKEKDKLSADDVKKLDLYLLNADGMKQEEMAAAFTDLKIMAPESGNELSAPEPFNLMFKTSIGPNGNLVGFLRPETAQGIFVNYAKLLEYNGGRMPFASAQIGLGFRNEIAPRNGLLRVREFQMAEIEHFVDPLDKSHPKFKNLRHLKLPLLSQPAQIKGTGLSWTPIGQAVDDKTVHNETLGYFLARIYLFLIEIGVSKDMIRLRQLSSTERAHYAQDCWDTEIETSFGWVECVSCADRSAYDLEHHTEATGVKLLGARRFKEAKPTVQTNVNVNKQIIGKLYKKDSQVLLSHIDKMSEVERATLKEEFEKTGSKQFTLEGKTFTLNKENCEFDQKTVNVMEEKYVPHVIEPSFGLGRILYCVLEHSFRVRDEKRTYFALRPKVAPVKVSILPLLSDERFAETIQKLRTDLKKSLITCKVDDGGQAIGKRYARTDEIGIPFAVTVDFDTLKDNTVTLRELNTLKQVRVPLNEVVKIIVDLSEQFIDWHTIVGKYPAYETKETE